MTLANPEQQLRELLIGSNSSVSPRHARIAVSQARETAISTARLALAVITVLPQASEAEALGVWVAVADQTRAGALLVSLNAAAAADGRRHAEDPVDMTTGDFDFMAARIPLNF